MSFENWNRFLTNTIAELNRDQAQRDRSKEPKHKGYQGEFQLAGLEYGYAWALSDCWRFEAYVGAGWMGTHYRYYVGDSTDQHLLYHSHGKLYWFGPTKAGISVKYIFNHTRRYVK